MRNIEGLAYWAVAAPLLARAPARIGYGVACWRGDWLYRHQAAKRTELARNLRQVLGPDRSPAALQRVTRDWLDRKSVV